MRPSGRVALTCCFGGQPSEGHCNAPVPPRDDSAPLPPVDVAAWIAVVSGEQTPPADHLSCSVTPISLAHETQTTPPRHILESSCECNPRAPDGPTWPRPREHDRPPMSERQPTTHRGTGQVYSPACHRRPLLYACLAIRPSGPRRCSPLSPYSCVFLASYMALLSPTTGLIAR